MMIGPVFELSNGIPLYKVFPTKAYRQFVYGMNYVLEYGMYSCIYLLYTVRVS